MSFRINLIDDDLSQLKLLETILNEILEDEKLVGVQINSSINYIDFFENTSLFTIQPNDLFILDVHLKTYFTGIDIAKKIKSLDQNAQIVYLTSDESKSLDAINEQTQPLGFIVKQLDTASLKQQLKRKILRYKEKIDSYEQSDEVLHLSQYSEELFISYSSILYISTIPGIQKKSVIHTTDGEIIVNYRLIDLKEKIQNALFQLDLKSYILNTATILSVDTKLEIIVFDTNEELYLGKKTIKKVIKFLEER